MFLLGLFGMAIEFALGPVCGRFCVVFVALKTLLVAKDPSAIETLI